jgi:glutathione S-transferase
MHLYNSIGPNPKVVRMFMKEKGIELPTTEVDIRGGENRKEPYLAKNPNGQCPALELDDGTILAEITAICEYLDDTHKNTPSLIGDTPQQRAETHMWTRRVDLGICEPMANGFRFAEGLKMFQSRIRCIPEGAAGLKATAQDKLAWLDKLMAGKQYIAGDRFTLADVLLFCFVDFFAGVGQPINPELKNIVAWHARVKERPSASA